MLLEALLGINKRDANFKTSSFKALKEICFKDLLKEIAFRGINTLLNIQAT